MFQSFDDVLTFLDARGMFHIDLGLARMEAALKALHVERKLNEPGRGIVQIVGTNGKGSTATFLASLAKAHGVSSGLYTSPHLVTPRERIRIDSAMLPVEQWPALAQRVHDVAPELTCFEFFTALAMLAFDEEQVELTILEAGLGGLYDATTAVPADVVCLTPIDLDHTKILGATLTEIATDKAGALRPGCTGITGRQHPEVMAVLQQAAANAGVNLLMADELAEVPEAVKLGLAGPHQQDNALLALAAWVLISQRKGWAVCNVPIGKGLSSARISGRFQHIPACGNEPPYIVDGGHNPHGLRSCINGLRAANIQPRCVIFSCLADKDVSDMLPLVLDMARGAPIFIPTIQDNERAMDGTELAERLQHIPQEGMQSVIEAMPRLYVALKAAQSVPAPANTPILVCGSLYLLGEFFTLHPQGLI